MADSPINKKSSKKSVSQKKDLTEIGRGEKIMKKRENENHEEKDFENYGAPREPGCPACGMG
jgi:hypothetical protein